MFTFGRHWPIGIPCFAAWYVAKLRKRDAANRGHLRYLDAFLLSIPEKVVYMMCVVMAFVFMLFSDTDYLGELAPWYHAAMTAAVATVWASVSNWFCTKLDRAWCRLVRSSMFLMWHWYSCLVFMEIAVVISNSLMVSVVFALAFAASFVVCSLIEAVAAFFNFTISDNTHEVIGDIIGAVSLLGIAIALYDNGLFLSRVQVEEWIGSCIHLKPDMLCDA